MMHMCVFDIFVQVNGKCVPSLLSMFYIKYYVHVNNTSKYVFVVRCKIFYQKFKVNICDKISNKFIY